MKVLSSLICREFRLLVLVPAGPIVAALLAMATGVGFCANVLGTGNTATLQSVFELAAWLLLLLCPAITMRQVAEERRAGTWDLVLAAPARDWQIIAAKFLAAWVFLALVLAATLPLLVPLEIYADPDYGQVLSGYIGLMLLGGAVLASGLFVSTLTESQIVAYLATTFSWLVFSLSVRVLPAYLPSAWADPVYQLNPLRRAGEFIIGLVDTAGIVYFLSITLALLMAAASGVARTRGCRGRPLRICGGVVLLVISLVAINDLAMHVRGRFDATRTRAYQLSDQTADLLDSIDEPWRIVVLLDQSTTDRGVVRQVDEVLRRYAERSSFITVDRLDPSQPEAVTQYEELVRNLIDLYGDELQAGDEAVAHATAVFRDLMQFAGVHSLAAEEAIGVAEASERETLAAIGSGLALLSEKGGLILDEVDRAMAIDSSQPIPRLGLARDILATALDRWGGELSQVGWWMQQSRSGGLASWARLQGGDYDDMTAKVNAAYDELRALGDLHLGELAAELVAGQGAVIMSQEAATMIPAPVLFPATGLRREAHGGVAFDQRFRGEEVISAAMRSLASGQLPTVVFMHGEDTSLLQAHDDNVDLNAARLALEANRFRVVEWRCGEADRPLITSGPVAWIVIPPSRRSGLEATAGEMAVLSAARRLIAEGEPMLLNLQPSMLPRYGQRDPWAGLVETLGGSADTGRVVLERVPVGPGQQDVQRGQYIDRTGSEHLVARAIEASRCYLPLPIPLDGGTFGEALILIEPSADRWIDEDWAAEHPGGFGGGDFIEPIAAAIAVERPGGQRAVVIGSGGWLLSWASDRAVSIGGSRMALMNPGNTELLLASTAWLAGLDDWVAAGPLGRQVPRMGAIAPAAWMTWTILLVVGLPALLLFSALMVAIQRRAA